MARSTKLRWTKSLQNELAREVKNYNQRITYAQSKGVSPEILPPKITVKQVRQKITTKRQYNQLLKDIQFATYKNLVQSPTGGKSAYQKRIERRTARRKTPAAVDLNVANRIKQLSKLEVNKPVGRFPREADIFMKNIGFTGEAEKDYDLLVHWLNDNPDRSLNWKNNYLKAVDNVMQGAIMAGNTGAVDKLQELSKLISQMDLEDYLIGQLVNEANLAVDYVYPERGGNLEARITRIIEEWHSTVG